MEKNVFLTLPFYWYPKKKSLNCFLRSGTIYIYIHTYIYTYTHTYIHTYTHTYIYIYTHIRMTENDQRKLRNNQKWARERSMGSVRGSD